MARAFAGEKKGVFSGLETQTDGMPTLLFSLLAVGWEVDAVGGMGKTTVLSDTVRSAWGAEWGILEFAAGSDQRPIPTALLKERRKL